MADSDGLENRCPRKGTVGSNPTLSAKPSLLVPAGLRWDWAGRKVLFRSVSSLTRPEGLMIDKGRRDVILIYSDIELVRAGPSIKRAG